MQDTIEKRLSWHVSDTPMCQLPPVSMRAEVQEHLTSVIGKSLTGPTKASELFQHLLRSLATPPALTTLRVNSLKYDRCVVISLLQEILAKQYSSRCLPAPPVTPHPSLSDVIVIPSLGPRDITPQRKQVVVGQLCGLAVLRGADVYAPGVMGAPKDLCKGDCVSVYADLDGKCKRGLVVDYEGKTLFVGNGIIQLNRRDLFGCDAKNSGVAVQMTEGLCVAPALNSELVDAIFLQNVPSIIASHVLGPQPGDVVLDMCAAPGGKTIHIGALMKDKGCIVALDKTSSKVTKLKENVELFGLTCVHCYVCDSTKALIQKTDGTPSTPKMAAACPPPYPPDSFDCILLDAPCSALGQRPQAVSHLTLKELLSYPAYQRKLITQAVGLLKPGGTLVYSTCTFSPEENECLVEWVLRKFPQLQLVDQTPYVGFPGLPGYELGTDEVKKLQRFWPAEFGVFLSDNQTTGKAHPLANTSGYHSLNTYSLQDTIGFFIAKFVKSHNVVSVF